MIASANCATAAAFAMGEFVEAANIVESYYLWSGEDQFVLVPKEQCCKTFSENPQVQLTCTQVETKCLPIVDTSSTIA